MSKEKKLFFITGHGRSGTNYMAHLFQYLGYEVGPQSPYKDGMAHNYPPGTWPPKNLRKEHCYLIQVVRDPWKVVESTYLAKYSLPRQNAQRLPEINKGNTRFEKTIRSVVLWNRAIKSARPDLIVKVEEAEEVCSRWLESVGLEVNALGEAPAKNINQRHNHGWHMNWKVPWEELIGDKLTFFQRHCREYGYPEERT